MNGKKVIEHHETVTGAIPSAVALESERRVTALEEGHKDIQKSMGDMVVWMRKIEGNVEVLASNINAKLDRITNKPLTSYVGTASLFVTVVGIAAGVILFTMDARMTPIMQEIREVQKDDDRSFEQWVSDYTLLIRNDERLNKIDGQSTKAYNRPQSPKRRHGRPDS